MLSQSRDQSREPLSASPTARDEQIPGAGPSAKQFAGPVLQGGMWSAGPYLLESRHLRRQFPDPHKAQAAHLASSRRKGGQERNGVCTGSGKTK